MYRYFYRLRRLPCHLCFFIFFILWHGDGVCFSCGFLGSVLWMVFVPLLVSLFIPFFGPFLVSFFASFRSSPCFSFRPSTRFPVSLISLSFALPHRFVSPFGRVG